MHRLGLRAGGTSPGTRSGPQPAHGRRDRPDRASCFRMPFAVAAFGWRGASRKPEPRELAQALLELFLQLVQLRALLRDLSLRLVLHFSHLRSHRSHLVVHKGIDAVAELLLGRGDLLAEHRAQSRCDDLIEIRADREIGMVQRAGEPGLDVEVRDAGDGPPDEIADLAVRKSGISRPGHVARTDREACADRIAVEIETELGGGRARIEAQRYARNRENRKANTADSRA